jgi:hypothetical protein
LNKPPCKISELSNNSLLEKSKDRRREREKNNEVDSGHYPLPTTLKCTALTSLRPNQCIESRRKEKNPINKLELSCAKLRTSWG